MRIISNASGSSDTTGTNINPNGSQAAIDAAKAAVSNAQNSVTQAQTGLQNAVRAYNYNEAQISNISTNVIPPLVTKQAAAEATWQKYSGAQGVAEEIFLGRLGDISAAQDAKQQAQDLTTQINSQTAAMNQLIANRPALQNAINTAQSAVTQAQNDANAAQANLTAQQADAAQFLLAQGQANASQNPSIVASKNQLAQSLASTQSIQLVIIFVSIIIAIVAVFYFIKADNIKV